MLPEISGTAGAPRAAQGKMLSVTAPWAPSGEVAMIVTLELLVLTAASVIVLPGATVTVALADPLIVTVVGSDVLQVTRRSLVTSVPKLSVSVAVAVPLEGSKIPVALIPFAGASEVATLTVATCPMTTTVAWPWTLPPAAAVIVVAPALVFAPVTVAVFPDPLTVATPLLEDQLSGVVVVFPVESCCVAVRLTVLFGALA